MKYGYVKTATVVPAIISGDCERNASEIAALAKELSKEDVELMLFPELCLTSSNCGDIYRQTFFIRKCEEAIAFIAENTKKEDAIIAFGAPIAIGSLLYSCTIILHKGRIEGVVPKRHVTGADTRNFANGDTIPGNTAVMLAGKEVPVLSNVIFRTGSYSFGIETGDDADSPLPQGAMLAVNGAEIILNPAAQEELVDRNRQTRIRLEEQSRRYKCGYMHANSGWGESTSDSSFAGYNAVAECGHIIAEGRRFATESQFTVTEIDVEKIKNRRRGDPNFKSNGNFTYIYIDQKENGNDDIRRDISITPFIPAEEMKKERFEEIFMIQATALARRIQHTRSSSCVIGISGGLDSTLALLVTEKACRIAGKEAADIIAVTMPGFGTSGRTYKNALRLMQGMGATIREISIKDACIQHFKDIGHDMGNHDITYENAQARERTQILMDIANKENGIVIGTGDLSELALGWATYNGDHMSMYGVNASVPKTLMQHLVRWVADNSEDETVRNTLLDIIDTPISPELIPAEGGNIKQKTEDLVGPYELHDFFLYNFVRNGFGPEKIFFLAQKAFDGEYDGTTIKKWLSTFMRRFFIQQFKRSCMPDGPSTGHCNLNTKSGWYMPADISGVLWTESTNNMK